MHFSSATENSHFNNDIDIFNIEKNPKLISKEPFDNIVEMAYKIKTGKYDYKHYFRLINTDNLAVSDKIHRYSCDYTFRYVNKDVAVVMENKLSPWHIINLNTMENLNTNSVTQCLNPMFNDNYKLNPYKDFYISCETTSGYNIYDINNNLINKKHKDFETIVFYNTAAPYALTGDYCVVRYKGVYDIFNVKTDKLFSEWLKEQNKNLPPKERYKIKTFKTGWGCKGDVVWQFVTGLEGKINEYKDITYYLMASGKFKKQKGQKQPIF